MKQKSQKLDNEIKMVEKTINVKTKAGLEPTLLIKEIN